MSSVMRRLILAAALLLPVAAQAQSVSGGGGVASAGAYPFVAAASNNEQQVKPGGNAAYTLYGVHCESIASATALWLKTYNGSPTMGTTAATDQWEVPAAGTTGGNGHEWVFPGGISYPAGLYVALTAGQALTDNTSTAAGAANCTVYAR